MKYVVDASVAFKWLVPERESDLAVRIRDEFCAGLHELITPDFFPVEVVHALTRAERQGRVTPAEGAHLLADLLSTLPLLVPALPLLPRAYELSSQRRIGVYDGIYVALSERESCELVTADERLVSSFGGTVRSLSSL